MSNRLGAYKHIRKVLPGIRTAKLERLNYVPTSI